MSTLKIAESYLRDRGAFQEQIHPVVEETIKLIRTDIPEHLRLSITLSELITLTSHLRKNIELYDGTIVPCNAISIALAASGVSKDSSMNKVRKALQPAYEVLNHKRKELARKEAEQKAIENGESPEEWLNYYESPPALQIGLGTVEGMVKHFSMLESTPLGAASITSSEVGTELQSNQSFIDIIKTLSIGYDLGKVPIKAVKAEENRVGAINHLPINALLFGSEDAILYDNTIKSKFKLIFNTQLARRTLFSFSQEKPKPREFSSEKDILEYHKKQRMRSNTAQEELKSYFIELVEYTTREPLKLTEEAQHAFDMYLEYNEHLASSIDRQYPISKLSRKHKQWLALKLSGNYAILDGEEEVTEENYILAINTIEMLAPDLQKFERELIKELYEQFSDYCKMSIGTVDNLYFSIHELRKLGYIPTTGNYEQKLDELLHLTSIYDSEGIYTRCDDGICYEPVIRENSYGVSAIEFTLKDGETVKELKARMAKECSTGYSFYETSFEDLAEILKGYYAYSPFLFNNGKRSKDNVNGKTKWIFLDVDNSTITDEETHFLLSDINHHIARTSDSDNPFKFRVILELDMQVDVPNDNWKYFIELLSNDIGVNADILPKSQIAFSYGAETVLSVTDAEPLAVKDYLLQASQHKKVENPKNLSSQKKKQALSDTRETFSYAYEAEAGEGSRSLYKAMRHALDLGMSKEDVELLIRDINDYWTVSMDEDRLQQTLLIPLSRL